MKVNEKRRRLRYVLAPTSILKGASQGPPRALVVARWATFAERPTQEVIVRIIWQTR